MYFFISYQESCRMPNVAVSIYWVNELIEGVHPLQWQINNRSVVRYKGDPRMETLYQKTLVSWNEVTKQEFENHEEEFLNY